ncbi:hypothetical protein DJ58_4448 [Yersinia frederiksenii ATCC 33641]|uniref:Uncharacterized protein n=1 Tax=Yersinia frederiksenii ATCC 33641 TaxID=349966 RepID=A0ABR4VYD9_YERFR|nr:hypothetical protein DJ58_4448 [Yersinia frederiksenii ATCC 33641]
MKSVDSRYYSALTNTVIHQCAVRPTSAPRRADILVKNIPLDYSEVIFDQRYNQLNKQEVKKYEQAIM